MLGGTQKSVSTEIARQVARPPFSCPEPLFVSVCNGCGECKIACFVGALGLEMYKR
ncbi:putative ferredoxin [Glaesserella parasuis SW140]|nr:putative ferredoxin [Glaesserella parasuis SW140]